MSFPFEISLFRQNQVGLSTKTTLRSTQKFSIKILSPNFGPGSFLAHGSGNKVEGPNQRKRANSKHKKVKCFLFVTNTHHSAMYQTNTHHNQSCDSAIRAIRNQIKSNEQHFSGRFHDTSKKPALIMI